MKHDKASPSIPTITDSSKGSYNDSQGKIFATVGTAGERGAVYHYDSKNRYIVSRYEGYGSLGIGIAVNKIVAKFYSDNHGSV